MVQGLQTRGRESGDSGPDRLSWYIHSKVVTSRYPTYKFSGDGARKLYSIPEFLTAFPHRGERRRGKLIVTKINRSKDNLMDVRVVALDRTFGLEYAQHVHQPSWRIIEYPCPGRLTYPHSGWVVGLIDNVLGALVLKHNPKGFDRVQTPIAN